MTRNEFIFQLRTKLKRLPQSDAEDAIAYYQGYFDDAGPENEQSVIEELGSPSEVAGKIISEFAFKQLEKQPGGRKGIGTAGWVVLAILASPIAFPLGIVLVAVFCSIIVAVLSAVFSVGLAGIVAAGAGIFSAVIGITRIAQEPATTLYFVGSGMVALSIGAAILWLTVWLGRVAVTGISRLVAGWMKRRAKR